MKSNDPERTTLHSVRSVHHDITVVEQDGVRAMRFGGRLQCAADAEALDEARTPAQDYLHLPMAVVPDAKRVLMIGLGGGILARTFLRDYPGITVDVVELDPEVVRIAREYFGLAEDPRLRVIVDDGRRFIETSAETWDVIILDALFEAYTPFLFATVEFMDAVRSRLAPGGVYAHNALGYLRGEQSGTFHRYLRTLRDAFASLHVFGVSPVFNQETGRRNYVILGSDESITREDLLSRVTSGGGGAVSLPRLPSFAEDLLPDVAGLDDAAPLRDTDAPSDGLMRS